MTLNREMLILARESRELTQRELAERIGIRQSKVSKFEAGFLIPTDDELRRLSSVLDYPLQFFEWGDRVYGFASHEMFHRIRQVPAKTLAMIHAQMNVRRMQVERLLRSVEIDGEGFRHIDPDEFDGNIQEIARAVRASWHLPPGPVRNLTQSIESAGAIVIPHDFKTRLIDAVSQWIPGLPPMMLVNTTFPMDRLRYTIAHEVGHLIMHRTIGPDAENEANTFAAELLLPSDNVKPDLFNLSLPVMASLKEYWGVSMAAILKRAGDLGCITPRHARTLWMEMSKLGYRRHEPGTVPTERPALIYELLRVHQDSLDYSLEDLAEILAENHLHTLLGGEDKPGLTVVA